MARKAKCPRCGSKKIARGKMKRKCKTCGHEWSGTVKRRTPKKDK